MGCWIPSPRKERDDSVMMALAMAAVAAVMIVGNTDGSTCFNMTVMELTPMNFAYCTYSRSFELNTSDRTRRAIGIQEKIPMTKMMEKRPFLKKMLTTVTITIHGIDWNTSTIRIRRLSTTPPKYPATVPTNGEDAYHEGDAAAVEDAGKVVAAHVVRAEPVSHARPLKLICNVDAVRIQPGNKDDKNTYENHRDQVNSGKHGLPVVLKLVNDVLNSSVSFFLFVLFCLTAHIPRPPYCMDLILGSTMQ